MFLLYPLSIIYGGAVHLRNFMYDKHILKVERLPVPVISVGNVSSGGTGKTSIVRYLAQSLSMITRVAVVLRGYRRRSRGTLVVSKWGELRTDVKEAGDEAYLLARMLPKVSVVVSEDRFKGGFVAVNELGAELIILDDGFQHRRLYRNVDIVLLKKKDLTDRLLPAGLLREPVKNISRADAIILSYQDIEPFEFKFCGKPVFKMFRRFTHLLNTRFDRIPLETLKDRKIIAFAGLGSNEQFFSILEKLGFRTKERFLFPDHYHYRDFELRRDEIYITTPKDMVKLPEVENLFSLDFEIEVKGLMDFVIKRIEET